MDLKSIGSVPLRMVAKTMRKQGKLVHTDESVACVSKAASCANDPATQAGYISGRQIAVLDSAAYLSVIDYAIRSGKVTQSYVDGIAAWALSKGTESAPVETRAAPQPNDRCECGHAWSKHSIGGGSGCLDRTAGGSYCQCYKPRAEPSKTQEAASSGGDTVATDVEIEAEVVESPTSKAALPVNGEIAPALRSALVALLGDAIAPKAAPLDEEAVKRISLEIAMRVVSETGALRVEIVKPDGSIKAVEGRTHKLFPTLVKWIAASDNAQRKLVAPFLVGPAGSGKTQACAQAAEALGLRFFAQSVCSQTTASVLMGYYDANGRYVRSLFREAYENGGLYLLDEIDAGNPNVLAILNSSLSNGHCAFPDGMVPRHADFRCCAAGNTYGAGRTVEYVGRNPIDAATGNRFVKISWPYDEKLERDICPNPEWAIYVQKWRAALARRGVKHILSPRQSLDGALGLAAGISAENVIDSVLTSGMDEDTVKAIRQEVGSFNG